MLGSKLPPIGNGLCVLLTICTELHHFYYGANCVFIALHCIYKTADFFSVKNLRCWKSERTYRISAEHTRNYCTCFYAENFVNLYL